MIRRITGEQADFQGDEGDGEIGAHGSAQCMPGVGGQPGRNIDCRYRQAAGVDRRDGRAIRLAYVARQAGAEQGIDDDPAQFVLTGPAQHTDALGERFGVRQCGITLQTLRISDRQRPHRPTGPPRQHSDQIAIARIVAVAGKHSHFIGCRPLPHQCPPGCMRGALHQFEARRARGNQPCVDLAHLCGAIQRVG